MSAEFKERTDRLAARMDVSLRGEPTPEAEIGKALLEAIAVGRVHRKGRGRSSICGVNLFVPVKEDGSIDLPRFRMYAHKKQAEALFDATEETDEEL